MYKYRQGKKIKPKNLLCLSRHCILASTNTQATLQNSGSRMSPTFDASTSLYRTVHPSFPCSPPGSGCPFQTLTTTIGEKLPYFSLMALIWLRQMNRNKNLCEIYKEGRLSMLLLCENIHQKADNLLWSRKGTDIQSPGLSLQSNVGLPPASLFPEGISGNGSMVDNMYNSCLVGAQEAGSQFARSGPNNLQ